MWAVEDPKKIRLLLRHGANVDVRSADGQTPLIIAAGRSGAGPAVKLLLEGGANPSEKASDGRTPLDAAAFAADDVAIQMLIEHGPEVQASAYASARAGCVKCVATLIRPADGKVSNPTVVPAVAFAYPSALKMLLDYGAVIKTDVKMRDMTCLMYAAVSDALPVGIARDLIERGADLNVKSSRGLTALDFARRLGAALLVDLLVKAGAKEGIALADSAMHPKPAATFRAAIERSIPLLQRTDVTFLKKAGCVSCHHNNLQRWLSPLSGGMGFMWTTRSHESRFRRSPPTWKPGASGSCRTSVFPEIRTPSVIFCLGWRLRITHPMPPPMLPPAI